MNVAHLDGTNLNEAVAMAMELPYLRSGDHIWLFSARNFSPVTDRAECFDLIQKFRVEIKFERFPTVIAGIEGGKPRCDVWFEGIDINKAVCRAVVAYYFGDRIELPK